MCSRWEQKQKANQKSKLLQREQIITFNRIN